MRGPGWGSGDREARRTPRSAQSTAGGGRSQEAGAPRNVGAPSGRRCGTLRGAMPWFVYLVRCRDGTLYTGVTNDPDARLEAHNTGRGARYTRGRGPVTLVHLERARGHGAALRREIAIKRLPRADKLSLAAEKRT